MPYKKYISFVYDNPQEIGSYDFVPVVTLAGKEINRVAEGLTKDPDFHCSYASKLKADTPDVKIDESLETIERCPICNYRFDYTSPNEWYKYNLSNYLDVGKQSKSKYFIYLHRRGEFEITFDIKKGNSKANDPDGYMEAMITPAFQGVEILSSKKIETEYNKQLVVKLKVKDEKNADGTWKYFNTELFQLDFFAFDNNKDSTWDWEGNAKGVIHCGQFNLISRNCVCENWPTTEIRTVIEPAKFVKYGDEGDCMKASKKQIDKEGYKLKKGWYDPNDESIYQIFTDVGSDKINDLPIDHVKERFEKGIKYLIQALSDSTPVIVGLDYADSHTGNGDKTTDHWVVIVGLGKDSHGCFFYYFENVDSSSGTSSSYKFYCDCKKYELRNASGNRVTSIRESTLK